MKTNQTLITVLAAFALFAFNRPVLAQYNPTGNDGMTASPKARQAINEYERNHTTNAVPAEIGQMSCPKCKDKVTTRLDYSQRGSRKFIIRVVTHLCKGCDARIMTTSLGKRSGHSEIVHTCSACGSDNLACCNLAKNDTTTTRGMEKDVGVAPLK